MPHAPARDWKSGRRRPDRRCCLVPGSAAAAPGARGPHIANACFALRSAATGRYVGVSGQGYRADQRAEGTAAALFWKPSSLRSYLPMDQGGSLLGLNPDGSVGRQATPGPASDWTALPSGRRAVRLRALTERRWLTASASGDLIVSSRDGPATIFRLVRNRGCTPFPEADVGATGRSFRGSNHKGDVFGFADIHVHITANLRAGGAVISGEPFDRFGITEALGSTSRRPRADGASTSPATCCARVSRSGPTTRWLAQLRRLAGLRHQHPSADLLRLAEAGLAGGGAPGGGADRRGPADLRDRNGQDSHSCNETTAIKLADAGAARAPELHRRPGGGRAGAGSGSSTTPPGAAM